MPDLLCASPFFVGCLAELDSTQRQVSVLKAALSPAGRCPAEGAGRPARRPCGCAHAARHWGSPATGGSPARGLQFAGFRVVAAVAARLASNPWPVPAAARHSHAPGSPAGGARCRLLSLLLVLLLCIQAGQLQESIAAALCHLDCSGRVLLRFSPGALKAPIPSLCLSPPAARSRCAQPPC